MIIEESPRPCTDIEELKAERSYYRNLLDDLADRANLYSANAFEELKSYITPRLSAVETKQKRDPRIKHRFVTVFPVNFIRGKHKCRDGVERSVVWEEPWKLGGVIFIPLFQFYISTRFINNQYMKEDYTYFSLRFIWWQINGSFWYSK